jgi:hypothetical protein
MRASLFGKIILTFFFTIVAAHLVDEEAAALRDVALENWKSENGYNINARPRSIRLIPSCYSVLDVSVLELAPSSRASTSV